VNRGNAVVWLLVLLVLLAIRAVWKWCEREGNADHWPEE